MEAISSATRRGRDYSPSDTGFPGSGEGFVDPAILRRRRLALSAAARRASRSLVMERFFAVFSGGFCDIPASSRPETRMGLPMQECFRYADAFRKRDAAVAQW